MNERREKKERKNFSFLTHICFIKQNVDEGETRGPRFSLKFKDEVCYGSKVKVNVRNVEGFGEVGDKILWNLTLASREGREDGPQNVEVIQSGEYEFSDESSEGRSAKKNGKKKNKKNKIRFTVQTKDVSNEKKK